MSYKYQQCPSCFELSTADHPACPFCTADLTAVNYHPWRRFFARGVDMSVILSSWLLVTVTVFIFLNQSPEELLHFQQSAQHFDHPLLSYPLLGAIYIFTEAVILSVFGNTPGKKLYRIQLEYAKGEKPEFQVALKRTFMVWSVGMGLTIPLVNIYALYMARKRLVRTGVSLWDANGGFRVIHGSWGMFYSLWVTLASALAYVLLIGIYTGGGH